MPAVMGGRKSWRLRGLGGRAGARRAGVRALALFAVTTALALVLAIRYELAWPAVLVGILGTLPALYVAWLAVPGVIRSSKEPAFSRRVNQWDPVELGVHQVIGGGPMPVYVRRVHDELLCAVLDPAVRASRLVVIRGGSSTGKSRAAYEAIAAQVGDWRLDYPLDPGALAARLDAGLPARTVLWLGELRQYADADGGPMALAQMADLLSGEGHLIITTVWPEHWGAYIDAARAGSGTADPLGTAGRLVGRLPELTGSDPPQIDPASGGVIDVPARFTTTEMAAVAAASDWVLAEAAAAAAQAGEDGHLAQYLAGVPDLLRRYSGPGGDPYGRAIITAAMDATRLGHASPLPAALLLEAAVGYLTDAQRTKDVSTWRDGALAWVTEELKGAIRALQPVPPSSGTGVAGYRLADYLDQNGRRSRRDQLGPAGLWDAFTVYATSARDLYRLAWAAHGRGLYRYAAALWTKAAALGSAEAAGSLIAHLRCVCPSDTMRAARWAAGAVSFGITQAVITLLEAMCAGGNDDAASVLATRLADQACLDDTEDAARLLTAVLAAGENDAARSLAARAADQVSLDDPEGITWLLRELRAAGEDGAARTLITRAAQAVDRIRIFSSAFVTPLLEELHTAGEDDAARTLAARADQADQPSAAAILHVELHPVEGLHLMDKRDVDRILAAQAAQAASRASLDYVSEVVVRLQELCDARKGDAVCDLADRAVSQASLANPWAIVWLIEELREAGQDSAAQSLAARAVDQASLDDTGHVASLMERLREAHESEAARTLANRAARAVDEVSLSDPGGIASLLRELRAAGASDAASTLAARAASQVSFDRLGAVTWLLQQLRKGREDDAARTLIARVAQAVDQVSVHNPAVIATLLGELRAAGEAKAVQTLATRAASQVGLYDQEHVARLLRELRAGGEVKAVQTLTARAASAGMFQIVLEIIPEDASSYVFGREPDGTPSQPWTWQEPSA